MPDISPLAAYGTLAYLLLATALAQVAFKHYHHARRRSSLWIAIMLFASAPAGTVLAARALGIGQVYMLTSLSYGLVAFLGQRMFGESVSLRQRQGLVLITLGCLLYTL